MYENYRTGMVDPATRVSEYLGRHRRTTGTHRREVQCPACNGTGIRLADGGRLTSGCVECRGAGVVPMTAVIEATAYTGRHRSDGPAR